MLLQVDSALDLSHTQNIGQMLKDHFQVHISIAIMTIFILILVFPASTRSSLWSASRMACSTMPMSCSGKHRRLKSIHLDKNRPVRVLMPIFTTSLLPGLSLWMGCQLFQELLITWNKYTGENVDFSWLEVQNWRERINSYFLWKHGKQEGNEFS